jgi:hypothetical protein
LNFENATSVSAPGWQATILVPDATVSNNSNIDGAVIASSFSGGGEIHYFAYQGTIPCFTDGTLIRTVSGDAAVEDLAIGDHVVTASGDARRIRWPRHRAVACARHPDAAVVWPICIRAGAFADAKPVPRPVG